MLFISVLVVTAYYFVRTGVGIDITKSENERTQTEVLLEKDIEKNYPSTPKEVLELYVEISKSFYNKNTTDKELDKLSEQMFLLFDEALIGQNPRNSYKQNLKNEIDRFREENLSLMNYLIGSNDEAEFWTNEGSEYASRIVTYTIKDGSKYTKVYNNFLMRKDDKGQWKILGWTNEEQPSQESKDK